MQRLEAALNRAWPQRRPGPYRLGDALEFLGPEVLQLEQIAEQFSCALGDDDRVRLGNALADAPQGSASRRRPLLLSLTRSDQIADDDESGCNADTGLQRSVGLERTDRCNQLQSGPYRPLGVVLVGLRVAEIHQHAIAHVLRHEPAEAAHGLGDAFLIGRNDLAQVLRVHARGECRRTDEVGEHHRDLAALGESRAVDGLAWRQSAARSRCTLLDSGLSKFAMARSSLASMTERAPRFLSGPDPSDRAERKS